MQPHGRCAFTRERMDMALHRGNSQTMDDAPERKRRLCALGAPTLADALLALAAQDANAAAYVDMLVSPGGESAGRIRRHLEHLADDRHFLPCKESSRLAKNLTLILEDVRVHIEDPKEGISVLTLFYETDRCVLENCNDSGDEAGSVYAVTATDLFVWYANACDDKRWVAGKVVKLFLDSNYGVRTGLMERTADYLPEAQMLWMAEELERYANVLDEKEYQRHHAMTGMEILARQLGDPSLFERARLAAWPELNAKSCLDIARVYHENKREDTALQWAERAVDVPSWQEDEKDELLYSIYHGRGDLKNAEETARRLFQRGQSKERFDLLVAVVGEEERARLLEEQTRAILEDDTFQQKNATFLVTMGKTTEAAAYLLHWAASLNGQDYYALSPVAKQMEEAGEYLAATVVYRALLRAVLGHGQSTEYPLGADYLHKLDALALAIQDWRHFIPHNDYKEALFTTHKRKRRFWETYGEQP